MPVIVVGADTKAGELIVDRLYRPEREIRVFVTDEGQAAQLRQRGLKVALGDVSDESHVEAAATRCFSAVLIAEAATDQRVRSFADTPPQVLEGWARAMRNSAVTRVIWVTDGSHPETDTPEVASVEPADPDLGEKVARLDDAQRIK